LYPKFYSMQEASFAGLLNILFYIFLIYNVFKILFRLLFPIVIHKTMQNMEERFRQQQAAHEPKTKTGETIIDKKPSQKSKVKEDGEYIDFEEID